MLFSPTKQFYIIALATFKAHQLFQSVAFASPFAIIRLDFKIKLDYSNGRKIRQFETEIAELEC